MRFVRRARLWRQTVVFHSLEHERGVYYRAVHLEPDGTLLVEGHDVGPDATGATEYEFFRRVAAPDVERIRTRLGFGPTDGAALLDLLRGTFGSTYELERWLADEGIESEFWSVGG